MSDSPRATQCRFRVGPWQVEPRSREASDGVRTRRLSPKALQVLQQLADAEGEVVRRSDLLQTVWPNVIVGDESLTQAVAELRRALGRSNSGQPLIDTVPKAGYRLSAAVLSETASEETAQGLQSSPSPPAEGLLPIEAHLAVTEARRLARIRGVLAAPEIERLIDQAIAIAPRAASVQAEYAVLMGLAAVHAGDRRRRLELASHAAESAVRLRPDLVSTHRALGFLAGLQGCMDLSLHSFSCALTIDPDDFETHYLAAQVCFGSGDLRKSLILGERAADLDPDDYRPAYNAARAALHMGERERGEGLARRALARIDQRLVLEPNSRRFLSARAAASAMLGRASEAIDVTLGRAEGDALLYDVVALAHQGEVGTACRLLEGLVERGWSYAAWLAADPISQILHREQRYSKVVDRMEAA